MELRLKSEPSFLLKKGLKEVILKKIGSGQYTVTSGVFKQVIKENEKEELLAVSEPVDAPPAQEEKKETNEGQGGNLSPREQRVVELNDLTKKELLLMVEDLYEDVDKKANKPTLVELIIKSEFPE